MDKVVEHRDVSRGFIYEFVGSDVYVYLVMGRNSRREALWSLPGGGKEGNETGIQTLLREVTKETGLKYLTLKEYPIPTKFIASREGKPTEIKAQIYALEHIGNEEFPRPDTEDKLFAVGRFPIAAAIKKLEHYDEQRQAVEKLARSLGIHPEQRPYIKR